VDIKKLVNPHLLNIKPYVPGKPVEEVQRELGLKDVIKMASNENLFGTSPKVVEAIRKAAADVNYYPDGGCFYLREALSKKFGVKPESIVAGSGIDELIRILCMSALGATDEILLADPSFVMYKISAAVADASIVAVPLKNSYYHDIHAMLGRVTERTKLFFVCNPNNPTGTIVKKDDIKYLMDNIPEHVIVVFDEAYCEYVEDPDYPRSMEYFKDGRNVVVFRTFSKAYGLAGLRVGYGFMNEELANVFHAVRNPFNVNSLAQAAALAALEDQDNVRRVVEGNSNGKRQLYRELDKRGIKYAPTEANFILIDTRRDSQEVFEGLLKKGVIVRPGAFLGYPTCIRVSISTESDNGRFIAALEEVLS
jgi:histidinol-phosphate aminotransferase